MKLIALSDTHAEHRDVTVPDGDVLVFAGDLMTCGRRFNEVQSFGQWFSALPHRYKILVAGNHDRVFEKNLPLCLNEFTSRQNGSVFHYLQDRGVTINGVKFWGSPWQPWFHNWAFNVYRGNLTKYWDQIPNDTDVLVTHGPPYGILDQSWPSPRKQQWDSPLLVPPSEHLGDEELTTAVNRVKPKVHIFGHIHGSYGSSYKAVNDESTFTVDTAYYNVAICDEQYNAANPATVIEI